MLWQSQHPNLVEFYAGMKPGAVRAEQELLRSGALDGLDNVIETADTGRVGVHVGQAYKLVHHLLVCSPVITEAAEVRNDK